VTASKEPAELDGIIDQAYRELERSRGIAQMILANARNEASEMVTRAKTQAAQMVREAQEQSTQTIKDGAENLLEESRKAYTAGFASGTEQGVAEGRRRFDAILTKVGGILDYLEKERHGLLARCRGEMVELVLRIAERVVRVERETIRTLLGENLRLLLEESVDRDEPVLWLNPADVVEVTQHLGQAGTLPRHRIHADSSVPQGECRVRSRSMNVDVSFERRFEAIRSRLSQKFGTPTEPILPAGTPPVTIEPQ
jgi:flagellar assembly protein FliH